MKKLLLALCMSALTSTSVADWVRTPEFDYRMDCPAEEVTRVVIALHYGSRAKDIRVELRESGFKLMLDPVIADCGIVVIPNSGEYAIDGIDWQLWDITNQRTYGAETARLIALVRRAKVQFNKPVIIVGASSGALMAYRIAITMQNMGIAKDLNAIVMGAGLSPYTMSTLDNSPFEGERTWTFLDYSYYEPADETLDHVALGLKSPSDRVHHQIFIMNGEDDPIIRDSSRDNFVVRLQRYADNIYTSVSGHGHNVAESEIIKATNFILSIH